MAVLGTAAALPGLWRFDPVVVSRNVVLLTGLAVGTVAVLPPSAAWVPATVVPLATWLLGTDTATRHQHPWAVLLAGRASTVAWVAALATVGAGVTAYTGRAQLTSGWWTRATRPRPE